MLVLMPKLPPMSGGTMKRSLFSRHAERSGRDGVHDERPHEVRPEGERLAERIVAADNGERLERHRGVAREAQPRAEHLVRLGERGVDIAVAEQPVAGEVARHLVVQLRCVRLERALRIDDRRQRLVLDLDQVDRILGDVAVARHDRRHRLTDEAGLVGRHAVVAHRRGRDDGEGRRPLGDLPPSQTADHAVEGERLAEIDACDPGVGVRAAEDRRMMDVRNLEVVDERAAAGQQPRILMPRNALTDPGTRCCCVRAVAHSSLVSGLRLRLADAALKGCATSDRSPSSTGSQASRPALHLGDLHPL